MKIIEWMKSYFQNWKLVIKKVVLPTKVEVNDQLLIVGIGLLILLILIISGDLFGEFIISKILEWKG